MLSPEVLGATLTVDILAHSEDCCIRRFGVVRRPCAPNLLSKAAAAGAIYSFWFLCRYRYNFESVFVVPDVRLVVLDLADNRYRKFTENSRISLTSLGSRRLPVAACSMLLQLLVVGWFVFCFFFKFCLAA